MKNIALMLAMTGGMLLYASEFSLFDIKSGTIEYDISGNGSFAGMGTVKVSGHKRIVFDDFGKRYLEEKEQTRLQNIMGNENREETRLFLYRNGIVEYHLDQSGKSILRTENPMAAALLQPTQKGTHSQAERNLQQMGAKKRGTDTVLGYRCNIWEFAGTQFCYYKGLVLKRVSNTMGVKETEIATKIHFGNIDEKAFTLPDLPVYAMSMEAMMSNRAPQAIRKSQLDEMDRKANASIKNLPSSEPISAPSYPQQSAKNNEPDSPEALQKALISAFGGEEAMVKQMKDEMLQAADPKTLDEITSCLQNAGDLKAARACQEAFREKLGGEIELYQKWDKKHKEEALREIEEYKAIIPCIKAAKTLQALQRCTD